MPNMYRLLCLFLVSILVFAFPLSNAQYGGGGAVPYPTANANFDTTYSTPDIIDNEVIDQPSIRCTDRGVEFGINTRNAFRGNIYVQGEFGLAECRREFYNSDAPSASIEVRLGDCGMMREKRPQGMSYSLTLITNFHPRFVTRVDRAYKIFCAYQQAERPVGVDLEVGAMPEQAVSSDAMMVPDCEYTMRVGELNGPLATGTVKVGELIYHRWECQRSDMYGMLVKNCRVFDGGNDNVTLLDERGCPTHTGVIQSPPVYTEGLNMAFAPVFAFHFPDRTQMNFRCQIQTCNKQDNECQALTPPNCQQQSYGSLSPPPDVGYGIQQPIATAEAPYSSSILPPTMPYPGGPAVAATVGGTYQQYQQMPPPPFIGAGISPSSPMNALPLDTVLQGNPSQVLQGLQRPWPRKTIKHRDSAGRTAGVTTETATPAAAPKRREQMELEHRILMATQQLKHNDGRWPPSLVIFGTGNKSGGAAGGNGDGSAVARRFFRPLEERELRQRQRRAEEHTQDVVATSTVTNDGLHGLEWSYENGKTRVRPRDLAVPNNNKLGAGVPMSPEAATQCLQRSTLVALFATLGMLGAIAILSLGYIFWDALTTSNRRRRCIGKRLLSWRSKGGISSVKAVYQVPPPSVFTQPIGTNTNAAADDSAIGVPSPFSAPAETERSAQEEVVHSPQTMLAGILNSNLFGHCANGRRFPLPSTPPATNVRR